MRATNSSLFASRRQLLRYGLFGTVFLLSTTAGLVSQQRRQSTKVSVIVVGAGIAGLAAAQKLKARGFEVTLLEGRDRVGGRIWTDRSLGFPVDMGASWIHGPQGNPITALAQQAKAKTFVTEDESVIVYDSQGRVIAEEKTDRAYRRYTKLLEQIADLAEDLDRDITVSEAIHRIDPRLLEDLLMQYQLTAYMEFDSGGAIERLSAQTWENDENFPGKDVLFPNGYDAVINLLSKGLEIKTGQTVQAIAYGDDRVTVTTNRGAFSGDCAVITLPLGVLQAGTVQFTPALPAEMTRSLQRVEMGRVNKVVLLFDQAFWNPEIQYFGFMSAIKGQYPYFLNLRTFTPVNALMTFGFGNYGLELEKQPDRQIAADITAILKTMFGSNVNPPTRILVSRWSRDPFAQGSYSYATVGSTPENFARMGQSVENRLFFAGEHTSVEYRATVHGAYLSGIRAAEEVMEEYA